MRRFGALLVAVLFAAPPSAQVHYVDDDAPGDPAPWSPLGSDPLEDGSAAHPFDAIAEALAAAQDGDEVRVRQGVYQGLGNRDLDLAGKAIAVRGAGGPYRTVINAQSAGRVFAFQSGETAATRIEGLYLANGRAAQGGGVLVGAGCSPVIAECVITWNQADAGAGAYVDGGSPLFESCLFSANRAWTEGGGLHLAGAAAPVLRGCTFARNEGLLGGAVFAGGASAAQVSSSILWNDAAELGAEVFVDQGALLSVGWCDVAGGPGGAGGLGTLLWGAGNLEQDPLFLDAAFFDFHLSPVSPCIDAGEPAFLPPADAGELDGEPRLSGAAVEIGVDEIHCGPSAGADCNQNGLPDECEPDCNQNGLPDECDIAAGASKDVNGDEIPDECAPWIQTWVDDDSLFDPAPGDPDFGDPLEEGSTRHPFDSIQEALDSALAFDFVQSRPGLYRGLGNRDVDFRGKAINLFGYGGPQHVTLDAEGLGRGFHLHSGELHMAHIDGFTVVNGVAEKGGGFYSENGSDCAIVECIFRSNTAQYGGAIAFEGHAGTLRNCIVTENAASVAGGGVWCSGSDGAFVRGCTISGNTAGTEGGALFVEHTDGVTLRSTIVFGNSAPLGPEVRIGPQGELLVSYDLVKGGQAGFVTAPTGKLVWGPGNLAADPAFADQAGGDLHITAASPCIDSGFPFFEPQPGETDFEGDPRVLGPFQDIGADEIWCQADLGYAGPGTVALRICGQNLEKPGSVATLLVSGAAPSAPAFLVAGAAPNPTPLLGGTLVPFPWLLLVDAFSTGAEGSLSLTVKGGNGPLVLYVQAVVPNGAVFEFSNALEVVQ